MLINTIKQNPKKEPRGKVVRNFGVARIILRENWENVRVIDLKPDKENPQRTVVVFEDTEQFQKIFSAALKENEKNKQQRENDMLKKQVEELQKKIEMLTNAEEE